MIEPVDISSPIYHVNRHKIYKWVFLLLKEHHERLGLKVAAWSGPEGINTPRFSFFFDRIRLPDGRPQYSFELGGKSVEMHIYQWTVGVFKPLQEEDPQLLPEQSQKELRTKDMLPWLNELLRITPLYWSLGQNLFHKPGAPEYWEHRAQRYLLSWNVLGLYLAKRPEFIRLENIGWSSGTVVPEYVVEATRFLPEAMPEDILVFPWHDSLDQVYWLHSGRIVRKNGESLDFYQLAKGGMPLDRIVQAVSSFMGDPARFSESSY